MRKDAQCRQYRHDLERSQQRMDDLQEKGVEALSRYDREIAYGGKVYSGDYSGFSNDRMDYHVFAPHKIVQKIDGQVVTDLELEYHWTNPYMVFPPPAEVAKN